MDEHLQLTRRLAACFTDHRRPDRTEHRVEQLVAQRVHGVGLGYEDLNDHDQLRADPMIAVLTGKVEPKGTDRRREQEWAKPGRAKAP